MAETAGKPPSALDVEWRFLGTAYTQHAVRAYLQGDRGRTASRRALLACGREGDTYDVQTWTRRRDGQDPKCKRCEALASPQLEAVAARPAEPLPSRSVLRRLALTTTDEEAT